MDYFISYALFYSWTHDSAKNNHRSLISPLSLRTIVSDLALWRHQSWSVTSCERRVMALWCHVRRLFCTRNLGQMRSSLVNNSRDSSGIHSLACKKLYLKMSFGKWRPFVSALMRETDSNYVYLKITNLYQVESPAISVNVVTWNLYYMVLCFIHLPMKTIYIYI